MATDPRQRPPNQTDEEPNMDVDVKPELDVEYSPTMPPSTSAVPNEDDFKFHVLVEQERVATRIDPDVIHAALMDAMRRGDYPSAEAIVNMLDHLEDDTPTQHIDARPRLEASDAMMVWRQRCVDRRFYPQPRSVVPAYIIDAPDLWGERDNNVLRKQHIQRWTIYNPSILDNAFLNRLDFAVQQKRADGLYVKAVPANSQADFNLNSNMIMARGQPNEVAALDARFGDLHPHDCWWIGCWRDPETGGFSRHVELNGELHVGTTRANWMDAFGVDLDREYTVLYEYFKLNGRNRYGPPSYHGYAEEFGPEGHVKIFGGARPLAGGFSIMGGMARSPWVALKMEQSAIPKMCGYEALFYIMGSTLAPGQTSAAKRLLTAPIVG